MYRDGTSSLPTKDFTNGPETNVRRKEKDAKAAQLRGHFAGRHGMAKKGSIYAKDSTKETLSHSL